MAKCCICGKEMEQARRWVCTQCMVEHKLTLDERKWPAWAQSELAREKKRRRFAPSFGVSSRQLAYSPYRRSKENRSYRKTNRVSRPKANGGRVMADNLFYSSRDDEGLEARSRNYTGLIESLPDDLRHQLSSQTEFQVIIDDAIRSLPLISQRAMRGIMVGLGLSDLATAEGVSESTMSWLIKAAKDQLRDILSGKLGADDGQRFK